MVNELVSEKVTEVVVEKMERDIYGSFYLGGVEFAISVKSIQEVINEPKDYNPMPLSPDYLLGLFGLRGMVVPIVDLRKIFNINDDEVNKKDRKVVIIEHGEYCVGLLFDKTGEVFNGNNVEKNQFNGKGDDLKDTVVEGVFKLDDGKRIVQIIDAHKILNLEYVPQSKDSTITEAKKRGKRSQCISFAINESVCAIGIDAIQEIIKIDEVENTALAGGLCIGAVDIRGNTVPIIDFGEFLGYGKIAAIDSNSEYNNKVIVMKVNDDCFGLLVNSIENIISYFTEDLIGFPVIGDKKKEMFLGCISRDEGVNTILLDHNKVLSSSEIDRITKGHSQLFSEKTSSIEIEKKNKINKKSYITFSIKDNYALEISEVKEVINYPSDIIKPPNLSKFFRGMLNLRGELIPIIDTRVLYSMESEQEETSSQILIFTDNKTTYGLVVDSIDSITSFSEDNKVKLPEIIYKSKEDSLTEAVKEAVQLMSDKNEKSTLLILNLKSIVAKIKKTAA